MRFLLRRLLTYDRESMSDQAPGRLRLAASLAWDSLPLVMTLLAAFGAALRLSVNDRLPLLAAFAYALRPFTAAAFLAIATLLWMKRRSWRTAAVSCAFAVLALAWGLAASIVLNPKPADVPKGALCGMFWNTWHGVRGWDRVAEEVRRRDPDMVWFTEADGPDGTPGPDWGSLLPEYGARHVEREFVVLAKGSILSTRQIDLTRGSHGLYSVIRTRAGDTRCVLADLHGKVFRHRGPSLERLQAALDADPPDLVVGDFNTPRDSSLFDALRQTYTHAFEACGRGSDGTWPSPVPVLPIDHVWGRGVTFHRCEMPVTGASDHTPVIFEWTPTAR
jgi:endonuclease/exonuclease/phosphatase family metal-dependent hydrolase